MPYYAHISQGGPVRYDQVPGSIGVLEAPDKSMPIGEADRVEWTDDGLAVWSLSIGGEPIAGRWVIRDRQFRMVAVASMSNGGGIQ